MSDSVKIRIMLKDHPSNIASESPWAQVVEEVSPRDKLHRQ